MTQNQGRNRFHIIFLRKRVIYGGFTVLDYSLFMKRKIPPLKPVTRILCDLQPLNYQTLSLLLRHFKNKMKNTVPKFLAAVTRKRHFLMIKKVPSKNKSMVVIAGTNKIISVQIVR